MSLPEDDGIPGGAPAPPASAPDAPAAPARVSIRAALVWWLTALIIAADQAAKALLRTRLEQFETITVIPGWVDFIHVQNAGVAFGILNETAMNSTAKVILTTGLAGLALFGITMYARHIRPHEKLARIGLSLILGGAIGNLIDRVHLGYVLDYIDVYHGGWHFWAFNIADASITIGAIFVFFDLLLVTRDASHPVPNR